MIKSFSFPRLLLLAGLAALSPWAARAASAPEEAYPLTTCVVSDEPLGSMGEAERYVHREEGKPDRVVYFCCGGCTEDFQKEPAKYLAKLDAAKATPAEHSKEQEKRAPAGR